MSTIDELIDQLYFLGGEFVQDGTFKVTRTAWVNGLHFIPYFKSDGEWWQV